jgi:hypothetical protein
VQLWTTLTAITGDLLTLAAAVINLTAALEQRYRRPRHPEPIGKAARR